MEILSIVFFYVLAILVSWKTLPFGKKIFFIISIAYVIRIIASYAIFQIIVFDDEYHYFVEGLKISTQINHGLEVIWNSKAWVNVSAMLLYIFGDSIIVLKAFNSFLGIIVAIIVFRFFDSTPLYNKYSKAAFYSCLFFPPLIFLSALALKEQLVSIMLLLLLWPTIDKAKTGWFLSILGMIGLGIFRKNLLFIIAPFYIAYILIVAKAHTRKILMGMLSISFVIIFVVIYINDMPLKLTFQKIFNSQVYHLAAGNEFYVAESKKNIDGSSAAVTKYIDSSDPLSLKNIFIVSIRSIYSPTPVRFIKYQKSHVILEGVLISLFWYICMPFFIYGIYNITRTVDGASWSIIAILVFIASAVSFLTNMQDDFRYRWPMLPLFFIISFIGFVAKDNINLKHIFIYLWVLSVLLFHYMYFYGVN